MHNPHDVYIVQGTGFKSYTSKQLQVSHFVFLFMIK